MPATVFRIRRGEYNGGRALGDNVAAKIVVLPCSLFSGTVAASSPAEAKKCSRLCQRGRRANAQAPTTVAALDRVRNQNGKERTDGTELQNVEPREFRLVIESPHTTSVLLVYNEKFAATRVGLVRPGY